MDGDHRGGKMKKILVLIITALLLLSGCAKEPTTDPVVEDKIYKVGVGVYTTAEATDATAEELGTAAVNTTFAWVVTDADGVIVYAHLDTVQNNKSTFDNTGAVVDQVLKVSKGQLLEEYNMKGASEIGKEWYEQVDHMEAWMIGKTLDEVINTELADGYPADADLATGTTIHVTDFVAALEDASAKLVEVKNIVSVGSDTFTSASFDGKIQFNTNAALVALDADGVVLYANIDVVQSKVEFDATGVVTLATSNSKKVLGDAYNMKGASEIGKEWFEQAAAFETWAVGKAIDAVVGLELAEGYPTDADLLTGTTIRMTEIVAAVDAANKAVVTLD